MKSIKTEIYFKIYLLGLKLKCMSFKCLKSYALFFSVCLSIFVKNKISREKGGRNGRVPRLWTLVQVGKSSIFRNLADSFGLDFDQECFFSRLFAIVISKSQHQTTRLRRFELKLILQS